MQGPSVTKREKDAKRGATGKRKGIENKLFLELQRKWGELSRRTHDQGGRERARKLVVSFF